MVCKKCQKETRACELHAYEGRCEDCYNEPKAAQISAFSLLGMVTMKAVLDVKTKKRRSHDATTTPQGPQIG